MLNTNILNINPEIVCGIIAKAKEFQAKEGVTFDETIANSEYEIDWLQLLADHRDDLTYQEVESVIEELEPDQQLDLLTLFYVGRGDFESSEWSLARKEAKNNIAPNLTGYLLSHPYVAEYLEAALSALGYACGEED